MADWTIEVQDFQSIKHAKINVVDGVNIVTGKTNSGKSAVFRAIDSAIFNTGTDDMVRVGKKIAGVTISNGSHTMVYCRNAQGKNEKTAYKFDDGSVQKKVGRSQLPEVQSMFGIRDVKMQNNVKMKLNFWYQNDKPFLMDKTSGQLYEFLTLSSCDRYLKVLKQMVVDIKIQEAEINNCNTSIDTLKTINLRKQEFVDKNDGFDELYSKILDTQREFDALDKILERLAKLKEIKTQIDETSKKLNEVTEKYNAIPFEDIQKSYSDFVSYSSRYAEIKKVLDSALKTNALIQSTGTSISEVGKKYDEANKMCSGVSERVRKALEYESSIKEMNKAISACSKVKTQLDSVSSKINLMGSKDEIISVLPKIQIRIKEYDTKSDELTPIMTMFASLSKTKKSVEDLQVRLDTSSSNLNSATEELENFKNTIGYCPFCGTVFSGEHTH